MSKENLPQNPTTDPALIPPVAYAEGLYAPETEPFKTSDAAVAWMRAAAIVLAEKPDIAEARYSLEADTLIADRWNKPGDESFDLNITDDLGNQYHVGSHTTFEDYGGERRHLSSYTTLMRTTPVEGYKGIVTRVERFDGRKQSHRGKGLEGELAYSVGKYDYEALDDNYEPDLNMGYDKLFKLSKKESQAADKTYVELASGLRTLVESRLGPKDPEAVKAIQDIAADQQKAKAGKFAGKLKLFSR